MADAERQQDWVLPWLKGGPEGLAPLIAGNTWSIGIAIVAVLVIGAALYLNNRSG